jgi:hypothetical protein
MKCRIHITTQGWLPQDPYIPSHLKIASNKHRQISKAKIAAGSTLLLIGLIAFSMFLGASEQSFGALDYTYTLNPGVKDSPFFVSSTYHTANSYDRQPTHDGKIIVNGGTVELTVQDSKDSHQIISTTIDDTYSFSIPASGDYEFVFHNVGSQKAGITLEYETNATYMVPLIIGSVALLVTALSGTVLIVKGFRSKRVTLPMSMNRK